MNDCGSRTGIGLVDDERDLPACIEASVALTGGHQLGIAIFVGTQKTGLTKRPVIANIYLETEDDVLYFKSLSELQRALRLPKTKEEKR